MYEVYPNDNPAGQIFLPAGDLNGDGSVNTDPRVGMLTGIAGVVRVRDGAALAFGMAGANISTTGFIRTPNATTIATARNALNTNDIPVVATDGSNNIIFGSATANPYCIFRSASAVEYQIAGSALLTMVTGAIAFGQAQVNPTIQQTNRTSDTATNSLILLAQGAFAGATGANRNGGHLILRGGPNSGAGLGLKGGVSLGFNGTTEYAIQMREVVTGQRIVSFCLMSAVGAAEMPANTGDGVIFIGNATTAPAAGVPVGGGILYTTGGALRYKGTAGTDSLVAPA